VILIEDSSIMVEQKLALFGDYHVTPTPTALKEAQDLFPRYGDYQEVRKHALKLAFWPKGESGAGGMVVDMDWEEIKGMNGPKAYELRIDDQIGGFNNLRLIFYVFEKDIVLPKDTIPRLWVISILQKKTERFSKKHLRIFSGRVKIVRQRKYFDYL
jgi:hypothetical protein